MEEQMDNPSKGKQLLGAFVVGGCMGVLTQIFYMLYRAIPADVTFTFTDNCTLAIREFSAGLALITCGAIMVVLFLTGVLDKINKVGGFGATIPLFGLVGGAAGAIIGHKTATGDSFWKSYVAATWYFKKFLLTGLAVCLVLCGIFYAMGPADLSYVGMVPYVNPLEAGTDPAVGAALAASGAADTAPLSLVFSFLIIGCLSVIGQLVCFAVKPKFVGTMNILMGGYILGCLLSMTGLLPFLSVYGMGGITTPVTGAGEFVFTSMAFGMYLGGTPFPGAWDITIVRLVAFCCVIISQFLLAMLTAKIALSRMPAPENTPATE
jgi:hypothetical protein